MKKFISKSFNKVFIKSAFFQFLFFIPCAFIWFILSKTNSANFTFDILFMIFKVLGVIGVGILVSHLDKENVISDKIVLKKISVASAAVFVLFLIFVLSGAYEDIFYSIFSSLFFLGNDTLTLIMVTMFEQFFNGQLFLSVFYSIAFCFCSKLFLVKNA